MERKGNPRVFPRKPYCCASFTTRSMAQTEHRSQYTGPIEHVRTDDARQSAICCDWALRRRSSLHAHAKHIDGKTLNPIWPKWREKMEIDSETFEHLCSLIARFMHMLLCASRAALHSNSNATQNVSLLPSTTH